MVQWADSVSISLLLLTVVVLGYIFLLGRWCVRARAQVSYMGFHATLGADYIDYVIADKIVCPLEFAEFYDEKIVHLPHTFVVADHKQSAQAVLDHDNCATRADFGIPEAKIVFACFSQHHKIDPAIFRVWMNVLKRVPNSLLWLLHFPAESQEHLVAEAERQGVKASTLHFTELVPKQKHLERAYLADIFLDTPAINAFTTACDMLWAGTPIITMPGQSMASRTCASMLHAVGLDEFVCTDYQECVALRCVALHPRILTGVLVLMVCMSALSCGAACFLLSAFFFPRPLLLLLCSLLLRLTGRPAG